jgi:hypothetical protein
MAHMTQHTQGPWSIELDHASNTSEFIRARIDGEMHDIASLLCDETGNASANARLIAAAPDLLALLQEVHDAISTGDGDFSTSGDWFRETAAALAKATGGAA